MVFPSFFFFYTFNPPFARYPPFDDPNFTIWPKLKAPRGATIEFSKQESRFEIRGEG